MFIPSDAIIATDKLSRYLLVRRPVDDKSQFLALGGFTLANPAALETAIRDCIAEFEAVSDGQNEWGEFYRVDADMTCPLGNTIAVALIWLQWDVDGLFRFVTLKPRKTQSPK